MSDEFCRCAKPQPQLVEGRWVCGNRDCGERTLDPAERALIRRIAVLTAKDLREEAKRELAKVFAALPVPDGSAPIASPSNSEDPISLPEAARRVRMTPRHFRDSMDAMGVKYTQPSGPGGRYLIDPASLPKPEAHNGNGKAAPPKRRKARARRPRKGTVDLLPVAEKDKRR